MHTRMAFLSLLVLLCLFAFCGSSVLWLVFGRHLALSRSLSRAVVEMLGCFLGAFNQEAWIAVSPSIGSLVQAAVFIIVLIIQNLAIAIYVVSYPAVEAEIAVEREAKKQRRVQLATRGAVAVL